MALYRHIDTLEAYKLGTEPVPAWFTEALRNGDINQRGPVVQVGCPFGWVTCTFGDYVIYRAAVKDNEGVTVKARAFGVMSGPDFEDSFEPVEPVELVNSDA